MSENTSVLLTVLLILLLLALMFSGFGADVLTPRTAIESTTDSASDPLGRWVDINKDTTAGTTVNTAGRAIIATPSRVAEAAKQASLEAARQAKLEATRQAALEVARQTALKAARQLALNKALKNIIIVFKESSNELEESSYSSLNEIADKLKGLPEQRLEVAGYTDNIGLETHNKALSKNRAQSVMLYLISRGIEAERLNALGYGSASPIDNNATKEGRAVNRRVELHIQ